MSHTTTSHTDQGSDLMYQYEEYSESEECNQTVSESQSLADFHKSIRARFKEILLEQLRRLRSWDLPELEKRKGYLSRSVQTFEKQTKEQSSQDQDGPTVELQRKLLLAMLLKVLRIMEDAIREKDRVERRDLWAEILKKLDVMEAELKPMETEGMTDTGPTPDISEKIKNTLDELTGSDEDTGRSRRKRPTKTELQDQVLRLARHARELAREMAGSTFGQDMRNILLAIRNIAEGFQNDLPERYSSRGSLTSPRTSRAFDGGLSKVPEESNLNSDEENRKIEPKKFMYKSGFDINRSNGHLIPQRWTPKIDSDSDTYLELPSRRSKSHITDKITSNLSPLSEKAASRKSPNGINMGMPSDITRGTMEKIVNRGSPWTRGQKKVADYLNQIKPGDFPSESEYMQQQLRPEMDKLPEVKSLKDEPGLTQGYFVGGNQRYYSPTELDKEADPGFKEGLRKRKEPSNVIAKSDILPLGTSPTKGPEAGRSEKPYKFRKFYPSLKPSIDLSLKEQFASKPKERGNLDTTLYDAKELSDDMSETNPSLSGVSDYEHPENSHLKGTQGSLKYRDKAISPDEISKPARVQSRKYLDQQGNQGRQFPGEHGLAKGPDLHLVKKSSEPKSAYDPDGLNSLLVPNISKVNKGRGQNRTEDPKGYLYPKRPTKGKVAGPSVSKSYLDDQHYEQRGQNRGMFVTAHPHREDMTDGFSDASSDYATRISKIKHPRILDLTKMPKPRKYKTPTKQKHEVSKRKSVDIPGTQHLKWKEQEYLPDEVDAALEFDLKRLQYPKQHVSKLHFKPLAKSLSSRGQSQGPIHDTKRPDNIADMATDRHADIAYQQPPLRTFEFAVEPLRVPQLPKRVETYHRQSAPAALFPDRQGEIHQTSELFDRQSPQEKNHPVGLTKDTDLRQRARQVPYQTNLNFPYEITKKQHKSNGRKQTDRSRQTEQSPVSARLLPSEVLRNKLMALKNIRYNQDPNLKSYTSEESFDDDLLLPENLLKLETNGNGLDERNLDEELLQEQYSSSDNLIPTNQEANRDSISKSPRLKRRVPYIQAEGSDTAEADNNNMMARSIKKRHMLQRKHGSTESSPTIRKSQLLPLNLNTFTDHGELKGEPKGKYYPAWRDILSEDRSLRKQTASPHFRIPYQEERQSGRERSKQTPEIRDSARQESESSTTADVIAVYELNGSDSELVSRDSDSVGTSGNTKLEVFEEILEKHRKPFSQQNKQRIPKNLRQKKLQQAERKRIYLHVPLSSKSYTSGKGRYKHPKDYLTAALIKNNKMHDIRARGKYTNKDTKGTRHSFLNGRRSSSKFIGQNKLYSGKQEEGFKSSGSEFSLTDPERDTSEAHQMFERTAEKKPKRAGVDSYRTRHRSYREGNKDIHDPEDQNDSFTSSDLALGEQMDTGRRKRYISTVPKTTKYRGPTAENIAISRPHRMLERKTKKKPKEIDVNIYGAQHRPDYENFQERYDQEDQTDTFTSADYKVLEEQMNTIRRKPGTSTLPKTSIYRRPKTVNTDGRRYEKSPKSSTTQQMRNLKSLNRSMLRKRLRRPRIESAPIQYVAAVSNGDSGQESFVEYRRNGHPKKHKLQTLSRHNLLPHYIQEDNDDQSSRDSVWEYEEHTEDHFDLDTVSEENGVQTQDDIGDEHTNSTTLGNSIVQQSGYSSDIDTRKQTYATISLDGIKYRVNVKPVSMKKVRKMKNIDLNVKMKGSKKQMPSTEHGVSFGSAYLSKKSGRERGSAQSRTTDKPHASFRPNGLDDLPNYQGKSRLKNHGHESNHSPENTRVHLQIIPGHDPATYVLYRGKIRDLRKKKINKYDRETESTHHPSSRKHSEYRDDSSYFNGYTSLDIPPSQHDDAVTVTDESISVLENEQRIIYDFTRTKDDMMPEEEHVYEPYNIHDADIPFEEYIGPDLREKHGARTKKQLMTAMSKRMPSARYSKQKGVVNVSGSKERWKRAPTFLIRRKRPRFSKHSKGQLPSGYFVLHANRPNTKIQTKPNKVTSSYFQYFIPEGYTASASDSPSSEFEIDMNQRDIPLSDHKHKQKLRKTETSRKHANYKGYKEPSPKVSKEQRRQTHVTKREKAECFDADISADTVDVTDTPVMRATSTATSFIEISQGFGSLLRNPETPLTVSHGPDNVEPTHNPMANQNHENIFAKDKYPICLSSHAESQITLPKPKAFSDVRIRNGEVQNKKVTQNKPSIKSQDRVMRGSHRYIGSECAGVDASQKFRQIKVSKQEGRTKGEKETQTRLSGNTAGHTRRKRECSSESDIPRFISDVSTCTLGVSVRETVSAEVVTDNDHTPWNTDKSTSTTLLGVSTKDKGILCCTLGSKKERKKSYESARGKYMISGKKAGQNPLQEFYDVLGGALNKGTNTPRVVRKILKSRGVSCALSTSVATKTQHVGTNENDVTATSTSPIEEVSATTGTGLSNNTSETTSTTDIGRISATGNDDTVPHQTKRVRVSEQLPSDSSDGKCKVDGHVKDILGEDGVNGNTKTKTDLTNKWTSTSNDMNKGISNVVASAFDAAQSLQGADNALQDEMAPSHDVSDPSGGKHETQLPRSINERTYISRITPALKKVFVAGATSGVLGLLFSGNLCKDSALIDHIYKNLEFRHIGDGAV